VSGIEDDDGCQIAIGQTMTTPISRIRFAFSDVMAVPPFASVEMTGDRTRSSLSTLRLAPSRRRISRAARVTTAKRRGGRDCWNEEPGQGCDF
jgi:hypothetical protein